jgi:decaprenyl-phosphate phosphoribosyltransferase
MKAQSVENKSPIIGSVIDGGIAVKTDVSSGRAIFKLIRVKQWVKNLFLFIPSFFAGHIFNYNELFHVLLGAIAFSFVASGVYVINDYRDREVDRLHPVKKLRPLASGDVKVVTAWFLMITLISAGLFMAAKIDTTFFYLLAAYLILNLGYSFGLKHVPILDLFIVALGFQIRIFSGGVIADVPITHWLSLMIFLLALFLILAKRRDDILLNVKNKNGIIIRKSTKKYNLLFINSCITLLSAVMIVAYIMYTVSPEVTERFHTEYLFVTTAFVIAGMMRYLQIVFVEKKSGSPTNIFIKDKFILSTIAGWILAFYLIIYAL